MAVKVVEIKRHALGPLPHHCAMGLPATNIVDQPPRLAVELRDLIRTSTPRQMT